MIFPKIPFLNKFNSIINSFYLNSTYWKNNEKEYKHLENLLKDVQRTNKINKKVVFNTVREHKIVIDREFFLGKLLALNGAQVYMLLDNGFLTIREDIQIDHLLKKNKNIKEFDFNPYNYKFDDLEYLFDQFFKKKMVRKAIKTYDDKNLEVIFYSDLIDKKDLDFSKWKLVSKYAKSSTIRFFKTSILNWEDEEVRYYYKIALINSLISLSVGKKILKDLNPDVFITSHGIYSTWGPAFDFLKEKGIKSLVYSSIHGHSLNPREIFISTNANLYFLSQSQEWLSFKENPLTKEMKKKVVDYFKKRQLNSCKDTKYLYKGTTSHFEINKNDKYKYHIALFPNVIWDGNISDRHKIFKNYKDWITTTINFIKNKPNLKLYIKSHPSEITVLKNSPRIVDIINKYYNMEKINNVSLIPPEKNINTYEFLKGGIDLGLVYDGFLAVEIPLFKIPTIMCVEGGMFAVENGNIIAKSKEEYIKYLENIEKTIHDFKKNYDERYKNIVKYIYWYIFDNAIKLPTLSKRSYINTELKDLKKKDLIIDRKLLKTIKD